MSDSWISWNPRIEEVLHEPWQIGEAQVDDLDLVVPDQVENVFDRFRHGLASLSARWCPGS
jgi:hypothetical protein